MEYKFIANDSYIKIDDTVWPNPVCETSSNLEWRMRHAKDYVKHSDMAYAASIISAYRELVMNKTQERRNYYCSGMKKCIANK